MVVLLVGGTALAALSAALPAALLAWLDAAAALFAAAFAALSLAVVSAGFGLQADTESAAMTAAARMDPRSDIGGMCLASLMSTPPAHRRTVDVDGRA